MSETKRERYIRELSRAVQYPENGMIGVSVEAAHEIVALLREQEAKVLTKSEAEQYAAYGIKANEYSESPPLYVEYKKPLQYRLKWVSLETVYSWMNDYETSQEYGSEFRFWTTRPSEQQMRGTKWEEDDNA